MTDSLEPATPPKRSIIGSDGEFVTPAPLKPLAGWLKGFYDYRELGKRHPLWGTLLAAILFVVGIGVSIVEDKIKLKLVGPDEFLVQIRDAQATEFENLKKGLDALRGSVSGADREALGAASKAVDSLQEGNQQLIEQLSLAKRENDTLRASVQKAGGPAGGYDFILSEHSSMRLDPNTILGVDSIAQSFAMVNLSSLDRERTERKSLESGESLTYKSAKGQTCKVSLLTLGGSGASASFAIGCA